MDIGDPSSHRRGRRWMDGVDNDDDGRGACDWMPFFFCLVCCGTFGGVYIFSLGIRIWIWIWIVYEWIFTSHYVSYRCWIGEGLEDELLWCLLVHGVVRGRVCSALLVKDSKVWQRIWMTFPRSRGHDCLYHQRLTSLTFCLCNGVMVMEGFYSFLVGKGERLSTESAGLLRGKLGFAGFGLERGVIGNGTGDLSR